MTEPSPRPAARDRAAAVLETELASLARNGSRPASPVSAAGSSLLAVSVMMWFLRSRNRDATTVPGARTVLSACRESIH